MIKPTIHTLFPDTVMKIKMDIDENFMLDLYNKQKWKTTQNSNCFTKISLDINVLDKYKKIQDKFLKKLNVLKNDVLNYDKINCKISTSWFTKTEQNMLSSIHNHANCLYSCVYYFKNEGISKIGFEHEKNHMIQIKPSKYNYMNASSDVFSMENDYAIYFPSYLKHQVKLNNNKYTRKSLAINFIPSFFKLNKTESKEFNIR